MKAQTEKKGFSAIHLIEHFGTDTRFWKTISDGVNSITVQAGQLHLQLKE